MNHTCSRYLRRRARSMAWCASRYSPSVPWRTRRRRWLFQNHKELQDLRSQTSVLCGRGRSGATLARSGNSRLRWVLRRGREAGSNPARNADGTMRAPREDCRVLRETASTLPLGEAASGALLPRSDALKADEERKNSSHRERPRECGAPRQGTCVTREGSAHPRMTICSRNRVSGATTPSHPTTLGGPGRRPSHILQASWTATATSEFRSDAYQKCAGLTTG